MDVQSSRATTAPVGEEDVCWARHRVRYHTRGLLGGGQGSGLGSSEDHVSNSIMARDAVTIATTTNLMVTEDVSSPTAFRAGDQVAEDRSPKPIPQAASEFSVLEVEAQGS